MKQKATEVVICISEGTLATTQRQRTCNFLSLGSSFYHLPYSKPLQPLSFAPPLSSSFSFI